jgi:filamentous hemagglutinin family protein
MRTSVLAKLGSTALSSAVAHRRCSGLLILGAASALSTAAYADPLPTGGAVVAGQATIATGQNSVTINQASSRSVINWNSFSVAADKTVTFNQPDAQAATLNRVTGSTTSEIAGNIISNGAVYLVNPNGIAITSSGTVSTAGGFVASTLDIADGDFMAGNTRFAGRGASAKVSNAGRVSATKGAYVALLGGSVSNSGYINVPLGRIGLGSGEQVALDINGGNFMQVAMPTSALTNGAALIEQSGTISASGGIVQLKAATLKEAVRNVINMSGTINADSATGNAGTIELLAGDGGTLTATGTLSARATGMAGNGGTIETSGADVRYNGLKVDTWSVGGRTGNWLIDPSNLTVDAAAASTIATNLATSNVTLMTTASSASGPGTVSPGAGDISIDAPIAWYGTNTLTISAYRNINVNAAIALGIGRLTLRADNNATSVGSVYFGANGSLSSLDSYNIDIFYNPTSYATPTDYSSHVSNYAAYRAFMLVNNLNQLQNINQNLSGSYALGANIDATPTASWNGGAGFVPIGTDGAGSYINYGFTGRFNGNNYTIDGLTINRPGADYVGLFGAGGFNDGTAYQTPTIQNVNLTNVNVIGSNYVGGLFGYIGTVSNTSMNLSHINVSGSVTSLGSSPYAGTGGVIGYVDSYYSILDQITSNGTVTGINNVGGLIGILGGSTIASSHSSSNVTGDIHVGGLIGQNLAEGTALYATGNVTGRIQVGGLYGYDSGGLRDAYSSGTVSVTSGAVGVSIGGLIGYNGTTTLSNIYSTSNINAPNSQEIGGIAGSSYQINLTNSYYAGTITAPGGQYVGALSGSVSGFFNSISSSYWDKSIIGGYAPNNVGTGIGSNNFVISPNGGMTTAQLQNFNTYASVYSGWDFASVWAPPTQAGQAGQTGNYYPELYALTPVIFADAANASRSYGSTDPIAIVIKGGSLTPDPVHGYGSGSGNVKGYAFGPAGDILSDQSLVSAALTATTPVGQYGILGNSATSAGGVTYRVINGGTGRITITPAPVTVTYTADQLSRLYGSANPALTGTAGATGLVNGDTLSGVTSGAAVFSTGATSASNAGSYAITGSGLSGNNSNYTFTFVQANGNATALTISPVSITVTALGGSSTYGSSPANPGFTATGLVNGQDVSVLTGLSNGFGISNTTNAGSYATNVVGTLTNGNYVVTNRIGGTWVVSPASIVVTALGGASTYGSSPANPGLSATGLANGQDVSVLTGLSNSFGINNATNAGSYATNVAGTLTNGNYTITNRIGGTWIVNSASIVVTALGGASTYGANPGNPGLSATGLVNGQDVSVLTGLSNSFGISNTTNAGSYATNVVGTLSNGNYVITNRIGGSWIVNPASVIVTALGGASIYGANPANPGLSATGLVNGQDVSVLTGLSNSFGIANTTNAGSYATNVVGTLTNGNYVVTNRIGGTWIVSPASIVVTALGGASTYGANPANPGFSATGLVNGQDVSVLTGLSNSFGISNTTNAGSYATNVVGTLSNGNYVITNRIGGTWVVNPASIVVTALGGASTYGANPANPGLSATGLVNGQDVSVLTGLSNSFGIASTTNAGSYATNVVGTLSNGNYAITNRIGGTWIVNPASIVVTSLGGASIYGSSPANPGLSATGLVNGQDVSVLTGLSNSFGISNNTNAGGYATNVVGTLINGNYVVTNRIGGTWIVNPAALLLTYTANGASSVYGSALAGLSGTVDAAGLVNGQSIADATTGAVDWSTGATASSNAGTYAITGGGLTANGNYVLTVQQASGNATAYRITPASLTLTYNANALSSIHGNAITGLTGNVSANGLVNGDTLGKAVSGSATWTTDASATSGVGSYAITGGGLSAAGGNYTITFNQAAGNAGALTITPRPLTITADALERFYGIPNPALTYNISSGANTGLVNGDTLTGSLATSATSTSPAGVYAITRGSLAASPNYSLTYVSADLKITVPPLQLLNSFISMPNADTILWLGHMTSQQGPQTACQPGDVSAEYRKDGKAVIANSGSASICTN